MDALAIGQMPDNRHALLGLDMSFPMSVWVRDSTGHWHAAWPARRHSEGGECMITFELIPPLTRSVGWIEVLAAGPAAEIRARLPLHWR